MRRRQLEIALESLAGFPSPEPEREQYATPAVVAAEMLHMAAMQGDLDGAVFDLGCGTGVLAIGAALLGAPRVAGFDGDPVALGVARANARMAGVRVSFRRADIADVRGRADCVVMNPPFGAQRRGADRPFLRKALSVAPVAYTLANEGSRDFVERFISPHRITGVVRVSYPMRRTFSFHRRELLERTVELYRLERRGPEPPRRTQ
ncbi:MAG: 50S ribosomal protein L11 methyltransferase [Euryarchaeota archaeon]|nr:50S ribosomal protein L11 methyltransferase [Euryarchaeota archaeon]